MPGAIAVAGVLAADDEVGIDRLVIDRNTFPDSSAIERASSVVGGSIATNPRTWKR